MKYEVLPPAKERGEACADLRKLIYKAFPGPNPCEHCILTDNDMGLPVKFSFNCTGCIKEESDRVDAIQAYLDRLFLLGL